MPADIRRRQPAAQLIEAELVAADPALVDSIRRWRPLAGQAWLRPGWSVVSPWMLMVFLIAFATWVVAPVMGGVVAVIGGVRAVRSMRR